MANYKLIKLGGESVSLSETEMRTIMDSLHWAFGTDLEDECKAVLDKVEIVTNTHILRPEDLDNLDLGL